MKKFFFGFLACAIVNILCAQSNPNGFDFWNTEMTTIAKSNSNLNWIYFNENVPPNDVFSVHKGAFGLGLNDNMQLISSKTDGLGWTHNKYQQYHQGLLVEGAIYNIHHHPTKGVKGNGSFIPNISITATPSTSESSALDYALTYIGASSYAWEDSLIENELKLSTNNPNTTYYPSGELVILSNSNNEYEMVWNYDIIALQPHLNTTISVDAHGIDVLREKENVHKCVSSLGQTAFNSPPVGAGNFPYFQEINSDLVGTEYR